MTRRHPRAIAVTAASLFTALGPRPAHAEEGDPWFDDPADAAAVATDDPPATLRADADAGASQGHRARRGPSARAWSLWVGRLALDVPGLDQRLVEAGYEDPAERLVAGGARVTRTSRRWVTGAAAHALVDPRPEGEARLAGWGVDVEIGRAFVATDRWLLYPALTLGARKLVLRAEALPITSPGLQPTASSASVQLASTSGHLGAALAAERRFTEPGGIFWSLGGRVGFTQDFVSSPWRDGDDAFVEPSRARVVYGSVSVAFGRWRS